MKHEWFVKSSILHLLKQGKELEVRVKTKFLENVRQGDLIVFNQTILRRIVGIKRYSSFEAMMQHEDASRILPGKSALEILILLRQIYPPERERRGVYVFELSKGATK